MALSKRGDYVVRSAIWLARAYRTGRSCKLREVADEMRVPRTFVSQILGDLVHAGLVASSFGAHGGYRLSRRPEEVSLLQVVEAGEGPLGQTRCVQGAVPCPWQPTCPLHETWTAASALLRDTLAKVSLADLAERDRAIELGTYPVPADAHRRAARSAPAPGSTG